MTPKIKILIADDDEYLRELITDTLEGAGYSVIKAKDGKEALEKTYLYRPDIMILDISMPHVDGYGVCEEIRKDILMRNLPIIMLTVKSSEKDEIKGLKAGVDDYIKKPYKPELLLARINSAIQRFQQGINVNPLTYLPGNTAIIRELENTLTSNELFAVLFIDLDNFKAFNDYYGFKKGDEIIKDTARILIETVGDYDSKKGFIGHIGGDDFIAIIKNERTDSVCSDIIKRFDRKIIDFYDEKDKENGYIITENRKGKKEKFPLMTLSIGVVTSKSRKFEHVGEISKLGNELKKYAKKKEESNYVIERRKDEQP